MNNSPSRFLGLLAVINGIDILVGIVFYELSFHVNNRTLLLTMGAFLILIGALLNPALVSRLYRHFGAEPKWSSRFLLITGMIGSIIALIGSGFDFLNTIVGHNLVILYPLSQTQSIITIGYAFLGIWLLLLNGQAGLHIAASRRLTSLGIITGTIMAVGLLAIPKVFIPYVALYHQPLPELGEIVGSLGWRLLYPTWSIWFGSVLGKGQYGSQHLQVSDKSLTR
jgi:hypothetical protein